MKKVFLLVILIASLLIFAGCSNTTTDMDDLDDVYENTATDMTTATTTDSSLVGEWTFEGLVDNKNYDIALDLEANGTFALDVEEDTETDLLEAVAQGTYVVNDDTITLTIETVQDPNSYFSSAVVQNGQVDLKYTSNNQVLTVTNASETIPFITDDLQLYKDY